MAAHLARHMGTIHASPKAKAAAKKRKRKSKKGRRRKRGGRPIGVVSRLGLRTMTLEQLMGVIGAAHDEARRKLAELGAMFT